MNRAAWIIDIVACQNVLENLFDILLQRRRFAFAFSYAFGDRWHEHIVEIVVEEAVDNLRITRQHFSIILQPIFSKILKSWQAFTMEKHIERLRICKPFALY